MDLRALRLLASLLALLPALACADDPEPSLAKQGEVCGAWADCEGELRCDRGVCVDDHGPYVDVSTPGSLARLVTGSDSVQMWINVSNYLADDQVEIELDPGEPNASSMTLSLLDDTGSVRTAVLELAQPLASGPHHIRARVLDADGVAYPNPSATAYRLVFAPDEAIPSTPQVAFLWPPAGLEHPLDRDLDLELATLPGSFAFSDAGGYGECAPLPDCEPAFAPECEDDCGPVDRFGHAKIYVRDDYPGCLLDEPIGCNGEYLLSLRPGEAELVDAFIVHGKLPTSRLEQLGPGEHELIVALSYSDHDPYPSKADVIYERVRITLVEP